MPEPILQALDFSRGVVDYYISLNSNNSINATGAKIIVAKGAVRNDPDNYKTDYSSMSNVRIKGGSWVSPNKSGNSGTTFSFAHCRNITLENMDIRTTHADGHAIELVGCDGVNIRKCTILAQGTGKATSVEEMVQIDLATPLTAPFLEAKFQNGLPCKNITVSDCTITGSRGLGANFAGREPKFINKYRSNIKVLNNKLTGKTSEALALFNTINATVKNNTIITNSKRTGDSHSIGCHVALFGTIPGFSKGKITVEKNTIKGGRQAFQLCSHTKSQYGTLQIKNNKLYCKKGKANALKVTVNAKKKKSAKKVINKKNTLKKWK